MISRREHEPQAVFSEGLDSACGRALPDRSVALMIDKSTHYQAEKRLVQFDAIFQREGITDSPTRHASLQR